MYLLDDRKKKLIKGYLQNILSSRSRIPFPLASHKLKRKVLAHYLSIYKSNY